MAAKKNKKMGVKKSSKKLSAKRASMKMLHASRAGSKNSPQDFPLRPVLFAPWRHQYISKAVKEEAGGCVFCDAVKIGKALESLIVFQGKTCAVILNKYPYNNGHTMIIPHRHTAEFDQLGKEEFEELHALLQKTYSILQKAYAPHGMNIGMNLGRVGGAGVLGHLHYHLVPRWNGDTNFMPIIAQTKVISEGLEETYQKLVALF